MSKSTFSFTCLKASYDFLSVSECLTSIQRNYKEKTIKTVSTFVHTCMIEISDRLYGWKQ